MNKRYSRVLLLACALAVAEAGYTQEADQNYEKAVQSYAEGEITAAYIHLKNALQQDPSMVSARILLAEMYFGAGDILGAEKESEEALRLGADINLVLPIYGPSLVIQQKTDTLLALEKKSASFSKATQFEWMLLKGQALLIDGKPERARAEFEKAAQLYPADVRSINSLAAIYLNSGMAEEARIQIAKSLTLDPLNAKTWQLRGEHAFAQNNFADALDYFNRAYELDAEDLRILRSLARVNLHLRDQAEMKRYLELIIEASPGDPAATLLNAILMIGQGDAELGDTMLSNLSLKLSALEDVQMHTSDSMLFIRASADYVRGSDQNAITLFNAYLARNKNDLAAIRMLVDLYVRNGKKNQATDLLRTSKHLISADLGLSLQLLHFYIQDKNSYAAKELLQELKTENELNANNPYVPILEAEFLRSKESPEEALQLLEELYLGDNNLLDYDLLRGALQLELNDYAAAENSAEHIAKTYPEAVRAQNFSAVTYLRTGKLDKAEASIARALELAPDDVDVHFSKAMLLKKQGRLEDSSKVINETLELRPSHTKSILLMARNLYQQGLYDEAIEWAKKAAFYDRTSPRPAELEVDIYLAQQDWSNAINVLAGLARENPINTDYQVELARLYAIQQDYEMAQRPLHSLSLLWQEQPEKLRQLAGMYVQTKNLPAARKTLEAALELDAESFPIRLDLARLYLTEGEHETAGSIANALQEKFGERAELSYLQGEIAMSRGELEAAQKQFMRAYQLDKRQTASIRKLYELSASGVGGEAFTDALEANLQAGSLPMWAVGLLADSYLLQGKTNKAAAYYERLLALPEAENNPAVLNNLANIYARDDLDKGLATAMKAVNEEGDNSPALLDTIGWILARKGENEKALPYLRKAYAINSGDPEIRYHTGVALIALGRTAEAEKELRAALVLGDDFAGRGEVERLVEELTAQRSGQ